MTRATTVNVICIKRLISFCVLYQVKTAIEYAAAIGVAGTPNGFTYWFEYIIAVVIDMPWNWMHRSFNIN